MNNLIDCSQTAFIKGRQIVDGVAVVQEYINVCVKNNFPCAILKLDFEKAFDSIDLDYICEVCLARGFSVRWINWVMLLLRSGSSNIVVNGVV